MPRRTREWSIRKPSITPIPKALLFFGLFMILFRIISNLLLKIKEPYVDILLLSHYIGFPTVFTYAFIKIFNEINFDDLGFKRPEEALKSFSLGALIGFCIILSFLVVFYFFGFAKVLVKMAAPEPPTILQEVLIMLILVYNEELIFRGYILNTARKSGLWSSIVVSSVTFGIAHINNPNANLLAILGLIVAGFLLAMTFLMFDNIWAPLGLHFMWNFTEEKVFGMPLSGLSPESWIFRVELTGPNWITGGDFGPEGGVLPVMIELIGILIIYILLRRSILQRE
ncbi:MAG: hypothetical protein DRN90_00395 [Thermoproteota archaeon]|nr:MAG: hypothetical protein DRN90_00395 [Candidatus Korarchaeota archaeon]